MISNNESNLNFTKVFFYIQEPKAGVASPSPAAGSDESSAPVQSNQHQTESTPRRSVWSWNNDAFIIIASLCRGPAMDTELAELQEKLVQQKENLLKDIRVIQKRKIKELDELYQIKLKKKDFEKELEKTREDIKKMEVDFQAARKQRIEQQQQTSELKTRCSLESVNRQNERLPSPLTISPSSHTPKTSQDMIWVRPNLLADRTQPPPRHQETGRPRSVWHLESQLQLPRPEDSAPTPPHLMPQLQQRRVSGDSSHSFSPDLRPDPAEHLQRLTEDARKSFQPYKPHHDLRRPVEQQAGPGYLAHPAHARPGVKDPERERLAMTQMTDSALASHLLEYYRSLGLLPPGPRLPPGQVSPVLIRPTPVTPGTRGEPLPGYHDPRHLHQAAAYMEKQYKGDMSLHKDYQRRSSIESSRPTTDKCEGCGKVMDLMPVSSK